ncbi:DUF485 domain-containing protein [Thermodesulfobacterium sp. TA1]|uniref:DUF485 domain-containing protein n=1 Tax=Thermodesulfobacterium sp. TA1 TaxID=2234087 RepID=UPI001232D751|nr:DUF485 domain-containing protein [Thermodesulfobacterium sp. TA1]QER42595.1 DUF485 domain-containing protein [Thermodesulfobacterium sp. TA1]
MKDLLNSPKFQHLVSKKNQVAFWLTLIQLAVYYGFIYFLAFKKEVLAIKVTDVIPLGIPIGILVIIISWLLTGVYTFWANNVYDKLVEDVKKEIKES